MKCFFRITLCVLLFWQTSYSQVKNTPELTNKLTTYLNALEQIGFSGTVLIDINDKIILSKGYGYSNQADSIKNEPSTLFDIGSLTKQFTSTAILKLEMQGKLSTDDKISRYFENVPSDKADITIHDLLRHQSGLKSTIGGDYDPITSQAFLDSVLNSKLLFKPGTEFSYSNIGYSLLGMIIQKVSGMSYEAYLYQNLWHPAGMEMTGYSRPAFDKNKVAVGYNRDDKAWGRPTDKAWDKDQPYWHLVGNGGILSTTEEFYKWHQAMNGDKILSAEAKNKLYHPKIRSNETVASYYAYGWDVSKTPRNSTRIWHNGSNNIFYTDFMTYPDEHVTLIMFTNKSHPTNFNQINFELSRIIFESNYIPEIPVADNIQNRKYTSEILDIIQTNGLDAAKLNYQKRDPKVDILEYLINIKGYELMEDKKYDAAINVFSMNTYAFPKSSNAFDSLAEAFMNKGDKVLAIKYYEKSLELNPANGNAVEMLKELKK